MVKLVNEQYLNGWLVKKFKTSDGTVFYTHAKADTLTENLNGEIALNDIEQTHTRPTEEAIKQLRYIKQVRRQQQTEPLIMPEHPLSNSVRAISSFRGKNRKEKLNEFALNLSQWLKSAGYSAVSFSQINLLFEGLSEVTTKRLRSDLIKTLKEKNLIKEEKVKKTYRNFQITSLFSFERINSKGVLTDCVSNGNKSIYRKKQTQPQKVFILN